MTGYIEESIVKRGSFYTYRGLLHNRHGPADPECKSGQSGYVYGEVHQGQGTMICRHGYRLVPDPAFWGKFSVIKIENPEGSWERGSGYGKRDIYTRK